MSEDKKDAAETGGVEYVAGDPTDAPSEQPPSQMALGTTVMIDVDAYEHVEEEEVKIRWNMRRTAGRPCTCCCQLCGLWVFSIIVLLILMVAVRPIEFSLDVPFYDRSEINQQRQDAYDATERDADFVSTFGQSSTEECVHDDPTVLTRMGELITGPEPTSSCQRSTSMMLRLIYIAKDRTSSIWTPENLMKIQEVESKILNTLELSRYCYLINASYPAFDTRDVDDISQTVISTLNDDPNYYACERIFSPLNFLDPLYFDTYDETGLGYYLLSSDVVPQEYNITQENLDHVINYWSNYTSRTYEIGPTFPEAAVTIGGSISVDNLFQLTTSSDFVTGSTGMVGLISVYNLGLPSNGYESSSVSAEDQYEDIGTWLWEEFDSYLKDLDLGDMDIYWGDSQSGMSTAEEGTLALASFLFFPISVVSVLLYLIYMQDSFFLGLAGIMQIVLSFVPSLIIYSYVVGQTYIGVLNVISFYIILGIGVDDIFVFCDQFQLNGQEKRLDYRMQKTYNVASKAMFTTSCTTFISFMANASSAFPAVSSFGIFSATLVLVNYCAVITFFPSVYAVYFTRIRKVWWDHPSLLFCCKRTVPGINDKEEEANNQEDEFQEDANSEEGDKEEPSKVEDDDHGHGGEHEGSALVRFFRDRWAPLMIKMRYLIVVVFAIILVVAIIITTGLEPDEDAPNTLPYGNNYRDQPDIMVEYFARAGNPTAIDVIWVSGIDPDDPIDRTGTDDTNTSDYGTANYLDCSTFDPTTAEAQVWSLKTCHDMFFGNVTEYHSDNSDFDVGGIYGPKARTIIGDNVAMTEQRYYSQVICIMQGFRDWTLTDSGCTVLQSYGLPCVNETSTREGCTTWDVNGNSCEPFPVPSASWGDLFVAFLFDDAVDANTQQNNYDRYSEQILVTEYVEIDDLNEEIIQGDFSCRTYLNSTGLSTVLNALSSVATLDKDFAQNYEDGIALYDKWDAWSIQMRKFAPREMVGTMQTSSFAWSFYFLNEILLSETFSGIALALGLGFLVLTFIGGNIVMAALSMFNILLIVVNVFAFTVLMGWSLGVIEAVNYVVVIGMSIDYSVHMSEAYTDAHGSTRSERVIAMVEEMGVSVLSGALSTLLAAFWMFFAPNLFFVKFASFLFATVFLSCVYALVLFPAILSIVGPLGNCGGIYGWIRKIWSSFVHEFAKGYIQSKQFIEHELNHSKKKPEEAVVA